MRLRHKRKSGSAIIETAAVMVVMLPVFILVIFVALECCQAYMIMQALDQGAREAARNLAAAYASDKGITTDVVAQDTYGFDTVRIHNIINSSQQFGTPTWYIPGDSTAEQPTVTVSVTYTPNQYGLPSFPNPDPLHIGKNFLLKSTSTYRLE